MAIDADPTTYSVIDFLRWQKDGTLDLRPPFQRNAVWRPVLKSSLIDSLLRGYPIPALFLQSKTDTKNFSRSLLVIDGQQRLRTILSYVDPASLKDRDDRDDFALLKIHDEDRAGYKFDDLIEDDRDRILNSRLNVYTVDSTVSDGELLEIFRRMNTYGAQLNSQELRNARYDGVFKELSYRLATSRADDWISWNIFNRQNLAEMRDAELTSDLLLLLLTGRQGLSQAQLDRAYKAYEDDLPESEELTQRFESIWTILERNAYGQPGLNRLRRRMWVYSLFDAVQIAIFGGSLRGTDDEFEADLDVDDLNAALEDADAAIEEGNVPDDVNKAVRGAANDRSSRAARVQFLLSHWAHSA